MRGRLVEKPFLLGAALATVIVVGCSQPPPEQSLRMAYPHELVTMDPHAHADGVTHRVMSAVFESLVGFEPGRRVKPGLADRWTTPDDFTWRIHVRDGVRFHNGSALTPEDVVASIERAREIGVRSHQLAEIEQVGVLENDERTIEIKTANPVPLLLTGLETVAIVPRDFDPSNPVGTGPYRWQMGMVQGPVVLRRWDDYWARSPDFDEITIQFVSVYEELHDLIDNQKLDVLASITESFTATYKPLRHWRMVALPTVATTYLGVNLTRPPFDDARVRDAIDNLIDRDRLVAAVYPLGTAAPAFSLVSPQVFGYSPSLLQGGPNPDRARQLLAEAGVAAGTKIRMDYQERYEPVIAPLAAMFAEAGLEVVPRAHGYETYYRRIESAANELFLFSWNFRVADASPFLEAFVHSRNPQQGRGNFNGAALNDPEIDRRFEEAAHETRAEARLELLQELLADLGAMHVYLPLFRPAPVALVREPFDVVGFQMRPQDVRLR